MQYSFFFSHTYTPSSTTYLHHSHTLPSVNPQSIFHGVLKWLCHKLIGHAFHQLTLEGWRGMLGGAIGSGRDIKTKGSKSKTFTANNLCDWCTCHLLCYLSVVSFTWIQENWLGLLWILCLMYSQVIWLFQVDKSMLVWGSTLMKIQSWGLMMQAKPRLIIHSLIQRNNFYIQIQNGKIYIIFFTILTFSYFLNSRLESL